MSLAACESKGKRDDDGQTGFSRHGANEFACDGLDGAREVRRIGPLGLADAVPRSLTRVIHFLFCFVRLQQLQQPSVNLKAVDDLYIDDEGDDDIQLADEASGAGPGELN